MRIVLTNAGKKEIIYDESEKVPPKNFISEEKVKYSPKFTMPAIKRESIKYHMKRFSDMNEKNMSEKRIFTEAPSPISNKVLRKSMTLKGPEILIFNSENKNDFKMIDLKTSKKVVPKLLNNIYSIKEKDEESIFDIEKINNKIEIKKLDDGFSLPIINKSCALKDILLDKNSKNVKKRLLNKQININENNLINYLKMDKTIKPSFIEKLNKADNDRLVKLDKICQKYFNEKKRNDLLQLNIQEKIKMEYSNDSKYCKENLINLQKNIQGYKKIYKSYFSLHRYKNNK